MPTDTNPTGSAARSRTADEGAFDTRLFTLVAGKSVDLGAYQGALVKVTGHVEHGHEANGTGSSGSNQNPPATTDQQPQDARNTAGANPTTGEGPQSSVHGYAPDRPERTIRVDKVQRVSADCSATTK